MVEGQQKGVQGVSLELEQLVVGLGECLVGASREELGIGSVELVADDGATEGGEVNTDLMLAPDLEIAAHERVGAFAESGSIENAKSSGGRKTAARRRHAHAHTKAR